MSGDAHDARDVFRQLHSATPREDRCESRQQRLFLRKEHQIDLGSRIDSGLLLGDVDRGMKAAEIIDEPVLLRLLTGPNTAARDLVHGLGSQAPAVGNAVDELLVDVIHLGDQLLAPARINRAGEVVEVGVLAASDGLRVDAQVVQQPANIRAREYDADPLAFKDARARWFTEVTKTQEHVLTNAKKLTLPLYVTMGTKDPIVSMPAAKRFFDATGSKDKTWAPQEGLLHEVLNEPSWKEVVEPIARWILTKA